MARAAVAPSRRQRARTIGRNDDAPERAVPELKQDVSNKLVLPAHVQQLLAVHPQRLRSRRRVAGEGNFRSALPTHLPPRERVVREVDNTPAYTQDVVVSCVTSSSLRRWLTCGRPLAPSTPAW